MYIFKLKLSEKARGYCMYVFLVIILMTRHVLKVFTKNTHENIWLINFMSLFKIYVSSWIARDVYLLMEVYGGVCWKLTYE